MKVLHSWLKEYVGEGMPGPKEVENILTFHAFEIDDVTDVQGDSVIDVKVLPDRAGDALSHRGIAREIATLLNQPLAYDPFQNAPQLPQKTEALTVHIADSAQCNRYMAALVQSVRVTESPQWLRERLEALGQRSINAIVDATNYVMLALGQPLHAYDASRLKMNDGVYAVGVRMAREGEQITTLSHEEKTLNASMQVIVDSNTDTALAVAGVKGGAHAEITESTTTILLESAHFNPECTRKTAQALKLPTDAAKRFENNLSPEIAAYALAELIRIVCEVSGGECVGYTDAYPAPEVNPEVTVRLKDVNARLNLSLGAETVRSLFSRVGLTYSELENGVWSVRVPFERRDIRIQEDVIDEVARVYGYEHIASVVPEPVPLREINPYHYYGEKIRTALCDFGFSEVITSSFRKRDSIELQNALASDKGCLRSVLRDNVRDVLDRNMPHADLLGLSSIQVFEIGTVFQKTADDSDVTEHMSLACGVRTKQQGYVAGDDARLQEVHALLEGALGAPLQGSIEKGVFECNLSALIETLPVPEAYEPYKDGAPVTFTPYSAYPFVSRDIALWVPEEVSEETISESIRAHAGPLLLSISCFDTFTKNGRISYAFRLIFQSFERTLTDSEVGEAMERITEVLTTAGFEVR